MFAGAITQLQDSAISIRRSCLRMWSSVLSTDAASGKQARVQSRIQRRLQLISSCQAMSQLQDLLANPGSSSSLAQRTACQSQGTLRSSSRSSRQLVRCHCLRLTACLQAHQPLSRRHSSLCISMSRQQQCRRRQASSLLHQQRGSPPSSSRPQRPYSHHPCKTRACHHLQTRLHATGPEIRNPTVTMRRRVLGLRY